MVGSLELTWKAHLLHTSVFETHGNALREHGVRLLECQSYEVRIFSFVSG